MKALLIFCFSSATLKNDELDIGRTFCTHSRIPRVILRGKVFAAYFKKLISQQPLCHDFFISESYDLHLFYFWKASFCDRRKIILLGKWYFSGINRSEEKYFRFCCVHGKVKVVRNQVYRRSKVVLGVLRVLSTLVVGFSVKKGPILLLKLRKVIVFFCELRKTLFSVLTRKKRTFLLHQEMGPFLLNTQQHRWTTLAHQELPCSCDKLDFWQPLLLHGRSNSGNIFSLDL